MTQLLSPPAELNSQVPTVVQWAQGLVVSSPEELTAAADRLKGIKVLAGRIEDYWKPIKQQASETHRSIVAKEREMLGPLAEAEKLAKSAILSYQQAEERIRRAEQDRLQQAANEIARRERELLEKKAAQVKTEAKKQEYQERAAAVVAPVIQAPPPPKVEGVATRKTWKAEVVDVALLPREFMLPNQKMLDGLAKSMGAMASVPGVRFSQVETLAVDKGPKLAPGEELLE